LLSGFPITDSNTEVTSVTKKLKNKAVHHPFTIKPGTILVASCMMNTLINSKKIPSEKMVMGIVRITNIGLMKLLSIPKTTATMIAVKLSGTVTPVNRYAAIKTATAVAIVLVKNFPILY
jgi:hypothetical protein